MKLVARSLRPAGTEDGVNAQIATRPAPMPAPRVAVKPEADSTAVAALQVQTSPGSAPTDTARTGRGGLAILTELSELSHRENVSDVQIQAGKLIYLNRAGSTKAYEPFGRLSFEDVYQMLEVLYRARTVFSGFDSGTEKDDLRERLMAERKLDFACEGKDPNSPLRGRFRVQAHFSHAGLGMTLRVLRNKLAQLEQCGLPPEVLDSLRQKVVKKQGLGLVVGPTGSGKTTTLSALIDWVRRNHHKHIVTVEDPIEYCYPETADGPTGPRPSPSLVTQQEVGHHVRSFDQGLNDALRKKPDIILVGEIRTAETLKTALEAAETGHFILSTLHTRGAGKTLGRMRQMFNLEQARSVLQQYADVGSFILSQGLMPDTTGKYVLCCEYFSIQEIEDRNAIRKYVDGSFQDVEERLNKPYNRRWNNELKALLAARRISQETFDQFYQVTGLENK
ncbi:MAG: Flp pilus assembly complex ATPase component TadA [Verrucomicrobia bacterium]|nr:Flp pilus assembly complex ATPase component TadA [Verrucomicrobiota bacterium]